MQEPKYLQCADGEYIAYRQIVGEANTKQPGLVFLSGFRSDMNGTKATACEEYARVHHLSFTRFDYYGHGLSSGNFAEGAISRWLADILAILDKVVAGPQILIGSSMGGWLALLAAKERPKQIKAIVTIAAAPDFTEDLMWQQFSTAERDQLLQHKIYHIPSAYDENPYPVTLQLIEDGRKHLLLRKPLKLDIPLRLIHGSNDQEVPWQTSLKILEIITSLDVTFTLVKDGDHRLSAPSQLAILFSILDQLKQSE